MQCLAKECANQCDEHATFCTPHRNILPTAVLRDLWVFYRAGQYQAGVCKEAWLQAVDDAEVLIEYKTKKWKQENVKVWY